MNEELRIIISAEVSKLKQGVEAAKTSINSFKKQVEDAKKNVSEKFKAMGESIKSVVKGIGITLAGLGVSLLGLAAGTEEYRNQQAQLQTAFQTAGASAEAATATYNSLYRVLGDGGQAQEAAQHLAKLTQNSEHLAQWGTICQGVYATFGASLPIESLTEAVNHTAQLGEVQGALADALEWSGIDVATFNEQLAACSTVAEREALIRSTLNGLYSTAAANYETNNAAVLAQRDAQLALQEQTAKLGAAVAPVITAFTAFAAEALAMVAPYISDLAERAIPLLTQVLDGVIEGIKTAAQWVKEHTTLLTTIAVVIGTITAAITAYNAVQAIKAAMAAAEVASVWGLVSAYAAQAVAMAAAILPYLLIAAAIAAVIAIIVLCVKHWDEIKEAARKAWEVIKQAWNNAGAWFKTNIVDKIKQAFANIGGWFSNVFTNARNGVQKAFSTITGFFSGIWENIKSIFSNVGTAIATGIKGAVSTAVNGVLGAAAGIINGFISAINVAIGVINAIPGVNIGYLSKLSVPAMAKGGIVDSATLAVVGEAGKEAVVPLENNLEWLDKLAGMLNDRMGGNQPIVLNVDGKRFAEISVDSINSLTRQRGSIPLVIA